MVRENLVAQKIYDVHPFSNPATHLHFTIRTWPNQLVLSYHAIEADRVDVIRSRQTLYPRMFPHLSFSSRHKRVTTTCRRPARSHSAMLGAQALRSCPPPLVDMLDGQGFSMK
ncbi:hypothetical protein DL93DRAFT_464535 [Clavulina sp. PMI_390]|nr:hypothetical protein DL93DRAFT_464535 [Clavulina sp. PMI_390]